MSASIEFDETTERVTHDALVTHFEAVGFGTAENYANSRDLVTYTFDVGGVYGFFAFANGDLIGAARIFSDDYMVSWIAEISVHPNWQRQGIASRLLERVNKRFAHTAMYADCFTGQEDLFMKNDISIRPKMTVCSRSSMSVMRERREKKGASLEL